MKGGPDRSRLIRATRYALVVQVVAIVIAVVLTLPDYLDRLLRPTLCTHCLDLRGLAFVLSVIFFAPVVLALTAVAWALRPGRIWPSWLVLAIDLALLGLIAYDFLLIVTGNAGTSGYAPLLVQRLQVLLVFVTVLASLALLVLLLNAAYGSPDRRLQLTRNVLIVQVLGMLACIALASPSLSNRLFNGYGGGSQGLAFALWTGVLVPAGIIILAAAWQLDRMGTWSVLLPILVNILLLAFLGLTGFTRFVARVDPAQSGVGTAQILVLVVPAVASLVTLALFRPPQINVRRPRSTAPRT